MFLSPLRILRTAAVLLLATAGMAQAQNVYLNGTVGGSVAPGVYGQITFGNNPPPPVLYAQPVIIQRAPVLPPPLYLYVPPGHSKNWRRYCARYNACGRPVYFVQVNERNRWWAQPHGGPRPDHDRRDERGDRGHGRGHDDHGRHNDHGRDDRGPGHRQFDN
ncbi:MAG: hypothetical protein ABIP34_16795 [Rhodoferax sp.]|uniref:hypothetical protein n=1 Tax=Rhodoferax sp. TaxID=50421 RepID=UPI00326614F7